MKDILSCMYVCMYPLTGWGWSHLPNRKRLHRPVPQVRILCDNRLQKNDMENKFVLADYFCTCIIVFSLTITVFDSTFCLQSIDCMI